jgi:hypothetical protein
VESRKNGQPVRGIIWWKYLVGSSPPLPGAPRAAPLCVRARLRMRGPSPLRGVPLPRLSQINGQNPVQLIGFCVERFC